MKVYRVSIETNWHDPENNTYSDETSIVGFAGDMADAKKLAKIQPDSFVDLVNIPTDKKTLVKLLNGGKHVADSLCSPPERTWERTPRGGLREVPTTEYNETLSEAIASAVGS